MERTKLKQLFYLHKEIELEHRRLKALEFKTASDSSMVARMTNIAQSHGLSDSIQHEIAQIRQALNKNIKQCLAETKILDDFICAIEDSETRLIFSLRYIDGLSWDKVAMNISPCVTADSVRKTHDRFLGQFK